MSNEQQAVAPNIATLPIADLKSFLLYQLERLPYSYRPDRLRRALAEGIADLADRATTYESSLRRHLGTVESQRERIDQLGESLQRARDEAGRLHHALQRERYAQSVHDRESNAEEVRLLRHALDVQSGVVDQLREDLAKALKDASDKQDRIDDLGRARQEAERQAGELRQENEHRNLQLHIARSTIAAQRDVEGRLRATLATKDDQIAALGTLQNQLNVNLATKEQAISRLQEQLRNGAGPSTTVTVHYNDPRVAKLEEQLKHCHQRLDRQRETIVAYQRGEFLQRQASSPKDEQVPRDRPSALRWLAEEEGAWE